MKRNMLQIFYNGEKIEIAGCPFQGLNVDGGYCNHPVRRDVSGPKIKCNYCIGEIAVPQRCPLRKGTTKIELLTKELEV